MKWLDKLADKLSEAFACPPYATKETSAQLPQPQQPVFTEAEINELASEVDKLNEELYTSNMHLRTVIEIGKFKKADQHLVDEALSFLDKDLE